MTQYKIKKMEEANKPSTTGLRRYDKINNKISSNAME